MRNARDAADQDTPEKIEIAQLRMPNVGDATYKDTLRFAVELT